VELIDLLLEFPPVPHPDYKVGDDPDHHKNQKRDAIQHRDISLAGVTRSRAALKGRTSSEMVAEMAVGAGLVKSI
jgi:hypothetical protein